MIDAPHGYPPFDVPRLVAPELWVVDAEPMRIMGAAVPVRMTVVRLGDGGLWLHSPTRFDPALLAALEALGPVRHLVAPNVAHWTFLKGWQRACPDAVTWAAPNLRRRLQVRLSRVRLDRGLGDAPPAEWAAEIDQAVIPGGMGFREVAFGHLASRTLALTDLVLNLEDERVPAPTRAYARATGTRAPHGSTPRYLRAAIRLRRLDAARAMERILAWDPERVVFAHGRPFEEDGAERLRRAMGWLLFPLPTSPGRLFPGGGACDEVGEAGEAPPRDDGPWRCVVPPGEVAPEAGDADQTGGEVAPLIRSGEPRCGVVEDLDLRVGEHGRRGASGPPRRSIVSQWMRQATTQHSAMRLARRSAVVRRASSIRHPDLRVLKVSMLQRRAYRPSLWTASSWVVTSGLVISFHRGGGRSGGGSISSGRG